MGESYYGRTKEGWVPRVHAVPPVVEHVVELIPEPPLVERPVPEEPIIPVLALEPEPIEVEPKLAEAEPRRKRKSIIRD